MLSPRDRQRGIQRVLWIILILNWLVAAIKIVLGTLTSSLSVLSDGFHSLLDGASNVVGLIAISVAHRPPDANHPYGHRKFEALAAMAICTLLALTCWEIIESVIHRLRHGFPSQEIPALGFAVLIVTLVINIFVAHYERRRGQELGSPLLIADSTHTQFDVLVTVLAIASLGAIRIGLPWMDLVAALIILGFIGHAGYAILMENAMTLTDAQRLDPYDVEALAREVPGVLRCTDVRTRGTPDEILVEMIIDVSPTISAREAETIEHTIESKLKARWPAIADVRVHHHTRGSEFARVS